MGFVSQENFLEPIDGVRTLFTTSQNYKKGMIWIHQGSLSIVPENFIQILPDKIRFIDGSTTKIITVDQTSPNTLFLEQHGFPENCKVVLWSLGVEPEGILRGSEYYITPIDVNRFTISLSESGEPETFTDTGSGDLCLAQATAPTESSGTLYYSAFTEDFFNADAITSGLWGVDTFITIFKITPATLGYNDTEIACFTDRIVYILNSASALVYAYLFKNNYIEYYADAKLPQPQHENIANLLRYCEGLLALKILLEEPGVVGKGPISEHIEKFTDAIQITKRYQAYGANKITTIIKKDAFTILDMFLLGYVVKQTTTIPMTLSKALPENDPTFFEKRLGFRFM